MQKDRQDLSEAGRAIGPLAEIARQVKEGKLTAKHLQALVEGRNPFQQELKIYLLYCSELSYEFDDDCLQIPCDSDWFLPFEHQLPVGTCITIDVWEDEPIYLEITDWWFDIKKNELDMRVKVHGKTILLPQSVAQYFQKKWLSPSQI